MRIFLSYSSHDRLQAEAISLALEAGGHQVFFDRDDLKSGDDYNAVIRQQVADAQLLIFLISPESVRAGAYTLTELRFAREKWSHPGNDVLPVLIAPTPFAQVPPYLKSVTILQPEGSIAAEVAAELGARARRRKRRLLRRYLMLAAAGVVVVAAIGSVLWVPARRTGWTSTIEASEFVSQYVYPDGVIERGEYALDPTFQIASHPDSLVRITRFAYGSLSDTAAAMSITLQFTNVTAAPLKMDINHRFFSLDDDQARKATLLYFCCDSGSELLGLGRTREMQLIFAANRDWKGKEIQARRINFRVSGLLPLTSGVWSVPSLAAAARAP